MTGSKLTQVIDVTKKLAGVLLIVAVALFIYGGMISKASIAISGWILWALFAFLPVILLGAQGIRSDAITVRIMVLIGPGVELSGKWARAYGTLLVIVGGLGMLISLGLVVLLVTLALRGWQI